MSSVICVQFDRLCVRAVGSDATKYLHSQLSNDIESLASGSSRYSFVLEPTGKVIALVRVTRIADDEFLLDTDVIPDLEDLLLARLNRFKIRVNVEFSSGVRTCVALRAENGGLSKEALAGAALDGSHASGVVVVDAMWGDGTAIDVIPVAEEGALDARSVSASVAGSTVSTDARGDVDVWRVRSGWPAMGREIEPGETLAAATGVVERAVSFTKGCYPGQELVERMDSRGASAPRTLRRVRCDALSSAAPRAVDIGDPVISDGREVGTVTSVAGEWALAYVLRGAEVGEPVSPGG